MLDKNALPFSWTLRATILILLATLCQLCPCVASDQVLSEKVSASAVAEDPNREKIWDIDKAIMLDCIDLARFNIRLRLDANRSPKTRRWLYPAAQETGASLQLSNTLTDLTQRADGWNNPARISKQAQKRGLACAITGNLINGTASASELTQNGIIALAARREGFSPARSESFVKGKLDSIDHLLSERELLLDPQDQSANMQMVALEGRLLKHIRNQLLYEFKTWSTESRRIEWSQNTFYLLDTAQNFTAMASSIVSRQGLGNAKLGGTAAITVLVANSIVTVNPILRDIVGRCIKTYQRRHLAKVFPETRPRTLEQLSDSWHALERFMSGNLKDSVNTRELEEVAFLVDQSQWFDAALDRAERKLLSTQRVADQQAIAGPLIGLFTLGRSISSTVAYYGDPDSPLLRNRINCAGRISQTIGQSYSLIATPAAKIENELYQAKLRREGKLPSQVLRLRLDKLDQLESRIRSRQY